MRATLQRITVAVAFALLSLPAASFAQTMFRFPASQLADQCGNGGCTVSAYKDYGGRDYASASTLTLFGSTGMPGPIVVEKVILRR